MIYLFTFLPPPTHHPFPLMSLCDRCGRTIDKQKEIPFKSSTDEIVFIQSQVRRVEQEIERLTAQRVVLQRRLNTIAASTVTLPYEIISTIFQHACPPLDVGNTQETNDNSSSKDGGITYPTLPFKLAAVCSQWRDIALSTPQLWTSVAFTLYQSRAASNAAALDTFFQRSGSCEVTVSLIFASGDEGRERLETETPPSQDVLGVFVKNSQRWGTLKIDGLPPEWIPALRAAQHRTPEIRQLWLCPYDNSREQQMVDIFVDAPELRRVTLDNTFLSAISLPWTGLTHLKVSWVSIDECAEMLRRCPNLLECDFQRILSNAEFHTLPSGDEPPVILSNLHTLKWSYAGDAWEFQLFERIRFPALKHFKMKLRYDLTHFQMIQGILGKLLGETSPCVERVDFDLGCPWVNVCEILKVVPRVKELRLVDEHDPEFVRGLMGALVVPSPSSMLENNLEKKESGSGGGGGVFLPELRSLEFQGNNPTDFSFPKLVVEQLQRRWDLDTIDLYSIEARLASGSSIGSDNSSTDRGGGGGGSSSSTKRRSRLESVNLELTSEVYVDGLVGQGIVKEGLKELLIHGMKVRIVNGFDGKTWL